MGSTMLRFAWRCLHTPFNYTFTYVFDAFVDIFPCNLQMKAVIEAFERQGDQLLMFLLDFKLHICLNVVSVSIL